MWKKGFSVTSMQVAPGNKGLWDLSVSQLNSSRVTGPSGLSGALGVEGEKLSLPLWTLQSKSWQRNSCLLEFFSFLSVEISLSLPWAPPVPGTYYSCVRPVSFPRWAAPWVQAHMSPTFVSPFSAPPTEPERVREIDRWQRELFNNIVLQLSLPQTHTHT